MPWNESIFNICYRRTTKNQRAVICTFIMIIVKPQILCPSNNRTLQMNPLISLEAAFNDNSLLMDVFFYDFSFLMIFNLILF